MTPDIEVARYALRTFMTGGAGGELQSPTMGGSNWVGGTCEAKCLGYRGTSTARTGFYNPRHDAPHEGCTCEVSTAH